MPGLIHVLCVVLLLTQGSALTINLGALFHHGIDYGYPNDGLSFENVASAMSLAIEDYQSRGGLLNVSFR